MTETAQSVSSQSNGAATQQIQIDPAQVASMTLEFLSRISMSPHERQRYSMCEQMLLAIARGELRVEQMTTVATTQ